MLALAQPIQQHTADCVPYQPTSTSIRPSKSTSHRNSAQSNAASSSSTVTPSLTVQSSPQEGHLTLKDATLPHSSSHNNSAGQHGDNDHHKPTLLSSQEPAHHSGSVPPEPEMESIDLHSYDPHDLLHLLASLLAQIATTNDNLPGRDPHPATSFPPRTPQSPVVDAHHPPIWRSLTTASRQALSNNMSLTFHARNVPTISLELYLLRILKYCPASNEVFLSLLVYFDRMSRLAKEACGRAFIIDSYNIHRLVIAGVTVASKFFSDVFYTNSRYAKVGGLPQAELNQLELQFLLLNDFRLSISPDEMQRYAEQLIQFSRCNDDPSNPSLPPTPSSPRSPAGPSKFMGSVDSYREVDVGVPAETANAGQAPPAYRRSSSTFSTSSYTTASEASETEAETDFDGSTDDEPTIRPGNSSETMSLRSTSDADSIYTEEGSREEHNTESEGIAEKRTPLQDARMMSP